MSDKSGGFFSSVGRFFSGASSSGTRNFEKSPKSSSQKDESSNAASPSTAPPAALLRDIIGLDGGSAEPSNEIIMDTTQNARVGSRLRYLSSSALDKNGNPSSGLEIEVNPEQDIFFNTPSISINRKRQLTELDRNALPQSFGSETYKRSRQLNRSLLEPTLKSTLNCERRTDMSWCGELTGNHSPASSVTNFSLLTRNSGATTNGSLSSRTQEIFKRLEDANTPAKEVQRMSMLRAGISRPESWGTNPSRDQTYEVLSTATPPPPLKKAGDAIPSRIQLISKSMGMSARRTPYWTDLTRKRTSSRNGDTGSETSSLRMLNGTLASAELSSVFSLDPPATKKTASSTSSASTTTMNSANNKKSHLSILKGPDGKPVGRNTFKLDDDLEDEQVNPHAVPLLSDAILANAKPLNLAPESAPRRGFLDNLSFSFNPPKDVVAAVGTVKTGSIASSVRSTSESKEVDSDSCESVEKQTSDGSSDDNEDSEGEVIDEIKESRPQTSADTISSAGGSSSQSSKDSSPKTAKDQEPNPSVVVPVPVSTVSGGNWDCQSCFCNWPASASKCGACQVPRPGNNESEVSTDTAPQRQLVSNIASFAQTNTSSFKFGCGGSSAAVPANTSSTSGPFGSALKIAPASTAKDVSSIPKPAITISTPVIKNPAVSTSTASATTSATPVVTTPAATTAAPSALVAPIAAIPLATSAAPTTTSGVRAPWDCPDCMVPNKASDDKCPCCGHEKYKSAASTSNVFGSRAFNAAAMSSTGNFAFGFGGGNKNIPVATHSTVAFGVTHSTTAPPQTSTFGLAPAVPIAAPELIKPEVNLFGGLAKSVIPASTAQAESSSSLFGNKTLFGTTKQNEETTSSIFGKKETSLATTATPASSIFGTATTALPGSSLFGTSKSTTEIPKTSSALSFGATSNSSTTLEVPKKGIFGNSIQSSSSTASVAAPTLPTSSLFSAAGGSSLSSTSLFSAKPGDSSTSSLFGGKPIQFSSDIGTTTTDGGVPAKRGMFSSDAPKLSFGIDQKGEFPKFSGFGSPVAAASSAPMTAGAPIFGTNSGSSLFGGAGSSNLFTASNTAAPAASPFGTASSTPFGSTTSSSGFGTFNSRPSQPGVSNNSSTNSLFPPSDPANPFGTSSTSNNGFNFGGTVSPATTGQGVFQFGVPAPPVAHSAPGGAFQFGNNLTVPQPTTSGSSDNAFSYQAPSNGGRKMALARRRNMQRK